MNSIVVNTESASYPIYFEKDFSNLRKSIELLNKDYSSFVIITDSNVQKYYVETISASIAHFQKPIHVIAFEAGEQNKNLSTMELFYDQLIKNSVDRKALILALGGGVTGDMAGFAAATYMRGIDFAQIPTSLLAQVDSSVGGKTGIDFNGYKNVIGAFNQPQFVFINVATLNTLPSRELYAGMSEVIKHALIKDALYYDFLKDNNNGILALEPELLSEMIAWSCKIKKDVVDEDEKEQGVRALLNFGHTLGHAIERLKGFELVHGECVSIGMYGELLLSHKLGYITEDVVDKGVSLIQAFNLPLVTQGIDFEILYDEMFHDKKTSSSKLMFALLSDLGSSFLSKEMISKEVLMGIISTIIIK